MTSDLELSSAMLRWAQCVVDQLSSSLSDPSIIGLGSPGWSYQPDGRIIFGPRSAYFKPWQIESLLYENGEWRALAEMSKSHSRMAMHCDIPVGTPYHGASQKSAKDFCYQILPRPSFGEGGFFLDSIEAVSQRISELIEEFNSDYITVETIWPICGLRVREPLLLNDELAFRPLTNAEKLTALQLKMIQPFEGQGVIEASATDWFGFVVTERHAKRFGDIGAPADVMEKFDSRGKSVEQFLSVAPVVGDFVAYHGGGQTNAPHFSSIGLLGDGVTGYGAGHGGSRFLIPDLSPMLSDLQTKRFFEVWNLVSQTGHHNSRTAKALRNAIRRIFFAETRMSAEDRLLDLMIAAESIYTMESRAELSFRLSLNAALWHDGTNGERRVVFNDMKAAYDLRSKIVHGNAVNGNEAAQIASKVREILKAGVSKAIDGYFIDQFPPKWEELSFPVLD